MGRDDSELIIDAPKSAKVMNKEDFGDIFATEMATHVGSFQLEPFCTDGYPKDIEIEDVEVLNFEKSEVIGRLHFSFTETGYFGCRDITIDAPGKGNFDFVLKRGSETVFFSPGPAERMQDRENPDI